MARKAGRQKDSSPALLQRMGSILRSAPVALVAVDEEGTVLLWNDAATDLFGWTSEEAEGRPLPIVPEKERTAFRVQLQDLLRSEGNKESLCTRRHKDGSLIQVTLMTSSLTDEKGEVIGSISAFFDPCAQHRIAEALERSASLLDAVFCCLTDALFIVEPSSRTIILANPALEKIFGYRPDEAVHRTTEFLHKDRRSFEEFGKTSEEVLDQKFFFQCTRQMRRKNGELFWAEITITAIDPALGWGEGVVSVVRDVSESVEARQQILETRDFLRAVIDSVADPVFVKDSDHRFVLVNTAMCALLGYSREEIQGSRDTDLVPAAEADIYQEMDNRVLETGAENINEETLTDRNGEIRTVVTKKKRYVDRTGARYIVGILRDITEKKRVDETVQRLAYFDPLTALPNRRLLNDRLAQYVAQADRHGHKVGILYFDLDNFKKINDSLGHEAGDKVLRAVAERLSDCVRKSDTISRLGGDEFVAVLADVPSEGEINTVARQILESMATPYRIDRREIFSSCSIGITIYPNDADDVETLLRNADLAMYAAKHAGRNNFKFFSEELNRKARIRQDTEKRLQRAIRGEGFKLHYQPQVDLQSGRVTGTEALVRWIDPEDGRTIYPSEFIPVAEETGLIVTLGQWILQEACRQNKAWLDAGYPPMTISVNLSSIQFLQPDLADIVEAVLNGTGLPARYLKLEITETILMEHREKTVDTMNRLKKRGVAFAIDDFGKGYSSLSYLQKTQVDVLKIDRDFVRHLFSDEGAAAIVDAIISLGQSLKLDLIAEGVETRAQMGYLVQRGCHKMQGYYFSRPLPTEKFEAFLQSFSRSEFCPFLLE